MNSGANILSLENVFNLIPGLAFCNKLAGELYHDVDKSFQNVLAVKLANVKLASRHSVTLLDNFPV